MSQPMQKEDEEYPLIGEPEVRHVGDRNTQSSQYTNRRVAFMTTVLLLLVSILVLSVGEFKFETNRSGSIELESTSIRWSLKRQGYDPLSYFLTDNLHLKYSFLNDYDAIVEPYAPMYLYVSDISSLQSSYSKLSFTVCPEDTSVSYGSGCQSGIYSLKADKSSLFTTGCAPPHVFSVNIYADSDEPLHSFRAVCMYVRREIRSLSDQDLNATMDAMAVMWNTPQTVGKMLYGNDFNNITYFTLAHYFGASHREADHIHEGVGFLPQHLKLSNAFEKSMQAVDNSVSLPYWDFTIDMASPDFFIFQPNTFGTLNFPATGETSWTYRSNSITDGVISDGRWANMKVEKGVFYDNDVIEKNLYGTLRGPWNLNPASRLTRFPSTNLSLPNCENYYSWLQKTSLEEFLYGADTSPHTGTHDSIGGQFGCDTFDFMVDNGWIDSTTKICYKWGTFMKSLWREHYLAPDESCVPSEDESSPSCGFACDDDRSVDMMDAFKDMADQAGVFSDAVNTATAWGVIKKFICTTGGHKVFFGDQRESASCYDPAFWPIHPTQERALHAKMLSGGFETTTWPNNTLNVKNPVCFRELCYDGDSNVEDYNDDCCIGHFEGDAFPDFETGTLSHTGLWGGNREYLDNSDPTSDDYSSHMRYIFDNFEWSHCQGIANNIDGLLDEIYSS